MKEDKWNWYIKIQVIPNQFWSIIENERIDQICIDSQIKEINSLKVFEKIKANKQVINFKLLIWRFNKDIEDYILGIQSEIVSKITNKKTQIEQSEWFQEETKDEKWETTTNEN